MVSFRRIIFPGLLPSFIKVRYYKWITGAKIGKGTSISFFSYIICPNVEIGNDCRIGPFNFIEVEKTLILGNRVSISMFTNIRTGMLQIGDDSEIMDNVRIGGILTHRSKLTIGKRVGIFPYAYINPSYEITLEDGVGIGGKSHLFTHGAWPSKLDGFPVKYAPITIKKNVWLGWRVTILPGVSIGENSILQAETLIIKNVPPNSIAKGNPATISRLYIFKYKDHQKINIIKELFSDFQAFLEFIGKKTQNISEQELEFGFKVIKKKKTESIIYFWGFDDTANLKIFIEQYISQSSSLNIIIFRSESEDEIFLQNRKKINFFILDKKKIIGNSYPWLEEVRDFFKRYGITFDMS